MKNLLVKALLLGRRRNTEDSYREEDIPAHCPTRSDEGAATTSALGSRPPLPPAPSAPRGHGVPADLALSPGWLR
jgi:hypothetical protein